MSHKGSIRRQPRPRSAGALGTGAGETRAGAAPPRHSITRETCVWQLGECVSSKETIKGRGEEGKYAFPNYLLVTYVK